ncbi:MAG: bifunctional riboflavin kinase/FAD synthetase [Actinobacteria bacterium]|nr:bifunctional riboflavin kinase/FAD synthetase [Actinomycetota bacterium]
MQVLRLSSSWSADDPADSASCPRPPSGTVVTIGAYDGVHLGHRAVIEQVKSLARERRLKTAVVTFDRHPASVVRPESAPTLLTDLEQKLELLAATGVDYTLVVHFDEARSKELAEEFVTEVLLDCLNARVIVVGADFHFGHQRKGNVALLQSMGADAGFEVLGVDLVGLDGAAAVGERQVSSTRVRSSLARGALTDANEMLGRLHEVRGLVVHGDARGHELGFPTANVNVDDDICLPADGIYAGWYVRPDGSRHPAAISLGRRPTYYDDQPFSLLEAHLLDGDFDLYGESARVQFAARLRDELKFESVDALIRQIAADCDAARAALAPSS